MAGFPMLIIAILNSAERLFSFMILLQSLFIFITIAAGFIAGFQYPLASELYFNVQTNVSKTGGKLYASDLAGAFLGAVVTSAILVPILGISLTCIALSLLNLTILIGLTFTRMPTFD